MKKYIGWSGLVVAQVFAEQDRRGRSTTIDAGTGLAVNEPKTADARVKRIRRVTSRECSRFVRQQVTAALPAICDGLLEKAKNGDVACAKALWQMAELGRKSRKPSVARPVDTGLAFARKVLGEFEAQ